MWARLSREVEGMLPEKDVSGCAIVGIMSEDGTPFSGETILRAIANMHERSNGLGGGFAGYGIYPDRADYYALHVMYQDERGRERACRLRARHLSRAQGCTRVAGPPSLLTLTSAGTPQPS